MKKQDKVNQSYIHSNNYKKIKRAGKWAMAIAVINTLAVLLLFWISEEMSVAGMVPEIIINSIVFFLGDRISTVKYKKTKNYLNIIMGILILSVVVRFINGLSIGLTNVFLFLVIAPSYHALSELKKDVNFLDSLSK